MFIPALFFAIPAAARGLPALFAGLHRGLGSAGVALVALGLPALGCYAVPGQVQAWLHSLVHVEPLRIGLDARQASLASELSRLTTKQARILWEDRPSPANRPPLDAPAPFADRGALSSAVSIPRPTSNMRPGDCSIKAWRDARWPSGMTPSWRIIASATTSAGS